jgi:hypothetical protein
MGNQWLQEGGGNEVLPGNWYLGAGIWDPLFWPPSHLTWAESAHRLVSGPRFHLPFPSRYCREDRFEEEKTKLEEGDGWNEDNADGDDPWDLQAGHGTHITGMIYAREVIIPLSAAVRSSVESATYGIVFWGFRQHIKVLG